MYQSSLIVTALKQHCVDVMLMLETALGLHRTITFSRRLLSYKLNRPFHADRNVLNQPNSRVLTLLFFSSLPRGHMAYLQLASHLSTHLSIGKQPQGFSAHPPPAVGSVMHYRFG